VLALLIDCYYPVISSTDVVQMNVYALGAAFLKFKQILPFNLKTVDPALYIPRFAARLEFASHEEEQKVRGGTGFGV